MIDGRIKTMSRSELQEIGNDIIKKQNELLSKHWDEWQQGRYTKEKAWEDAVKEICLLK